MEALTAMSGAGVLTGAAVGADVTVAVGAEAVGAAVMGAAVGAADGAGATPVDGAAVGAEVGVSSVDAAPKASTSSSMRERPVPGKRTV
eukprot:7067701-Prymnesium_polylepis.1